MAETYLVTGGAGFIGSNIVQSLVDQGGTVRVFDNLSTGKINNLTDVRSDMEFIKGDIRNLEEVQKAMPGIDYVFHQAALPSVPRSIEDPLSAHESNITGTLNILLAARDNQVKRVVYAGSSSAYGDTPTLPKHEDMNPAPLSPYALTKLAGEYYCRIFTEVFGLETITLRYFNVFGPRQNPESQYAAVIPKFIDSLLKNKAPTIYGDGEQTRDFTYVENVVSANLLATQVEQTLGEVVNVATNTRISLNHLYSTMQNILDKKIPPVYSEPRPGDVKHSLADISRAEKLLGYKTLVELDKGLQKTIDWMQTQST